MTLRIKALACALAILVLGSAGAATGTASKRVLLLYDEDKEFPGLAILHQSLRTTLKTALEDDVDLYTESMNLSQFRSPNYDRLLREHYQRKYGGTKLDLIVAVMGPSLQFLLRHGEEIFPGTPIVFCGADASDLQGITLRPNITGAGGQACLRPHAGPRAAAPARHPQRDGRRRAARPSTGSCRRWPGAISGHTRAVSPSPISRASR